MSNLPTCNIAGRHDAVPEVSDANIGFGWSPPDRARPEGTHTPFMRQIVLTFRTLQSALWISASHAETVERIFDVRFGKSDVLNVSAEMK
jgi:hypothetical protein